MQNGERLPRSAVSNTQCCDSVHYPLTRRQSRRIGARANRLPNDFRSKSISGGEWVSKKLFYQYDNSYIWYPQATPGLTISYSARSKETMLWFGQRNTSNHRNWWWQKN